MSISRIAGLFLAVAVSVLAPGSATGGWDEAHAAYERGDYQSAFRELVPLAVAGDPLAQVNIGGMNARGEGIPQNYTEALHWYRMAADQGNALAQFSLGAMYYHGQGVPQDFAGAARWCRMAAEQGHADAQTKLGAMYALGQGVPQNDAEAVRWFRLAADQGFAQAQFNLGVMYDLGQGVPQNDAEAVRWLRMAAEQGNAEAQYYLGKMHASGQGVPQNDAEAVRWYRRAAEQGDAEAQASLGSAYLLGKDVPQNDTEAMRWYRRAADQGDVGAQKILGLSYALGKGVRQDYVQAYVWLDLATARLPQGEDRSQTVESRDKVAELLSPAQRAQAQEMARNWRPESQPVPQQVASPPRLLTDGRVPATPRFAVPPLIEPEPEPPADTDVATSGFDEGFAAYERGDYRTAFREFMPLAIAGDSWAQMYLGMMYHDAKNYAEAARWYRRASDQGIALAQFSLGMMYYEGRGFSRNYVEAARWLRRAANQGFGPAQATLGAMYARAQGVPQDYVQAYMWLNLTAGGEMPGDVREMVAEMRHVVAARLSPAQRAQAQELARQWRPTVAARSEGETPVYGDAKGGEAQPSQAVLSDAIGLRVMEVQQSLADVGYDPGPADGVLGPRTRTAIRAFQADKGLPVDGEISADLYAALNESHDHPAAAWRPSRQSHLDDGVTEPAERDRVGAAAAAPGQPRLDGAGTGFVVSQNGQIVTNHHVVADCAEVRVRPGGQEALAGAVVAQDPGNDLALLQVPVHMGAAAIRDDRGIRAGDSVVAVGFPLPGLLASEANVTTGTVSALAGIGNDTRFLQVTVPVQAGSSGGPLLDLQGRVVGVVVGKLDALEVASVTGDIPQNVNFAIKASVVRNFLDASGVGLPRRDALAEPAYPIQLSPTAVAADAKAFTVLVECWK